MIHYDTVAWDELTDADRARWASARAESPSLSSPFFDLAFLDVVQSVRRDLRVLRGRGDDNAAGFLAYHRSAGGLARPAAGPMSDWHGVVAEASVDFDVTRALAAGRLGAFAFENAPSEDAGLAVHARRRAVSHVMDLSHGYDAWRAARGSRLKSLKRHERALAAHDVRFVPDDRSPETLDALIAWKRDQFRRTSQFDLFQAPWTGRLLRQLFETRTAGFRGVLSSLTIDGRLAAVHFGIQSDNTLHYWFPAYSPASAELAPGLLLLNFMAAECEALGVKTLDLGKGYYRYKQEFANAGRPIIEGRAIRGALHAGADALIRRLEAPPRASPLSIPGRLVARLDRRQAFMEVAA